MGFFMLMKRNPLLLVLLLIQFGCGNSEESDIDQNETQHNYSNFPNFPISQFHTIKLGDELSKVENQLILIGGKEIAIDETVYYLIESDSTEILIPNKDIVNHFKVFLRSNTYLKDETNFRATLAEKADRIMEDSTFTIFYFESNPSPFKLTYFVQPAFIRLNFTLIEIHS